MSSPAASRLFLPTFSEDIVGSEPLNVLILDDVEVERLRLRRLCRKAGLQFELFQAADLAEFRQVLDTHVIDIAFLDYHLAMDTGLDALKILIGHENQVNAIPIMVTSVDRHDIAVTAMRRGCADYLTKEELSIDSLRRSITSAFERRLLIGLLAETHSSRAALQLSVIRFARTCGPQARDLLGRALSQVRGMQRQPALAAEMRKTLSALEESCSDIIGFLEDMDLLAQDHELRAPDREALACGSV